MALARTPTGEIIFWQGYAQASISRMEFRGKRRKVSTALAGGLIGYALAGRDKTKKYTTNGLLVVTGKTISFPGDTFKPDEIANVTIQQPDKVHVSLISQQDHSADSGVEVRLEVTPNDNQVQTLYAGLMQAKTEALAAPRAMVESLSPATSIRFVFLMRGSTLSFRHLLQAVWKDVGRQ